MGLLGDLLHSFSIIVQPLNLLFMLIGASIGQFVGILPGLGVAGTIAILMPLCVGMNPVNAMVMFASVFCGARFGGAVTAIMLNLPGESSSVVTCLDGYPLSLQGRTGPALGLAALSSFIGGSLSILGLLLLAPALSRIATQFGPPEFFALTFMGLCMVTSLSGRDLIKGLLAATLGLVLASVGADPTSGSVRLIFGNIELMDGVSFVSAAVGLFALGEILINVEENLRLTLAEVPKGLRNLLPTLKDIRKCIPTWIMSTIIGFFVGVLPGAGASIASFISYAMAKSTSRTPERFGAGAVEGVAAAESANNSAVSGALVPMLTLGIPGSSGTAMLMIVLFMMDLRPGPLLITEHPEIFWGIVGSVYMANIFLLILNIPLIPMVVQCLKVPYYLMYIIILAFAAVGVFSVDASLFDLWLMGIFGIIGYLFKKLGYPPAALVLALILGPMVERSFRQSLIMSDGSLFIFMQRPLAAVLVFFAFLALLYPWFQYLLAKKRRRLLTQVTKT